MNASDGLGNVESALKKALFEEIQPAWVRAIRC
jgi:hypothetical protein